MAVQGIFGVRPPPVQIIEGGTGAKTASVARSNLGLAIGTDVQKAVITTRGDVIVGDSAGSPSRAALGALGTALVSDGTDAAFAKITAAGLSSGMIAQVVTASNVTEFDITTTMPFDDTIPQNTEGDEIETVAITPKNASSTLLIEWSVPISATNGLLASVAVFVDATAAAIAAQTVQFGDGNQSINSGSFTLSAGSTSARTYKIRAGLASGTLYVNSNLGNSRFSTIGPNLLLKVTEILP